jgi:pyruvate formate lyase activating enzyme
MMRDRCAAPRVVQKLIRTPERPHGGLTDGQHTQEVSGREVTVGEVLTPVLRDRPFYACSGGGMTLSGGEPLAQPDFAKALLAAAKAEDMHCCVETCGFVDREDLLAVRSLVDLFLYDLKDTDDDCHRRATGVSNVRILKNLRALHDAGALIRLRVPVIPDYNARSDLLESVARLCAELPNLEGVEVMPYHRLGESKVERFGLDPANRAAGDPPEPTEVAHWQRQLESGGVRVVR